MPTTPRGLTPGPPPRAKTEFDEVDLTLLRALLRDGRASNVALARQAGIAESTCIGRVRSLQQRGFVTGFQAVVEPTRVGLPIQAMVAVRLAGHDREKVDAFADQVSALPGVVAAYNVSGSNDFLVHVLAGSPDALREFVLDELSGRAGVVNVETSLIFRTSTGSDPLGSLGAPTFGGSR
jgi:DNA-binding Lrp family transcriptional regulator